MKPPHLCAALFPCLLTLLSGCRTTAQPRAAAAPEPAAVLVPATYDMGPVLSNDQIRTPSVNKAYFVGSMRDPRHPELLYRPGMVIREETPERWNLNSRSLSGTTTGALRSLPDPAVLPPTSPETEQLVVKQQKLMQLLSDNNAELSARVAELEAGPAPAGDTAAATHDPVAPIANGSPSQASKPTLVATSKDHAAKAPPASAAAPKPPLMPNADGVIAVSNQYLDDQTQDEPNPFTVRYQVTTTYKDIPVEITATIPGPRGTATINGQLVSLGDHWEGFVIGEIARDYVVLKRKEITLQVPIARDRTYVIKLPE